MRYLLQVIAVIYGCLILGPPVYADQSAYGVSPTWVAPGSKVTVSLPKEHPKGFAIRTPSGDWIYIVDLSLHYSFFPSFTSNESFTFLESALQGIHFVDGKGSMTRVFTQQGQYEFYFADNLETEPENTFSLSYTVTYQP